MKTCIVCGSPLPPPKRGRPRDFCSDECRQFDSLRAQMSRKLLEVSRHMTHESKIQIRRSLWSVANYVNGKEE